MIKQLQKVSKMRRPNLNGRMQRAISDAEAAGIQVSFSAQRPQHQAYVCFTLNRPEQFDLVVKKCVPSHVMVGSGPVSSLLLGMIENLLAQYPLISKEVQYPGIGESTIDSVNLIQYV